MSARSTSCMMMTRGGNGTLGRGALRLDLSFRHTEQDRLYAGSQETDAVLRPKVDFARAPRLPLRQRRDRHAVGEPQPV